MQEHAKQSLYSYSYEQRWYHRQPMPMPSLELCQTKFLSRCDVTSNLQGLASYADGVTGITERRRTGLIFSPAPYTAWFVWLVCHHVSGGVLYTYAHHAVYEATRSLWIR